MKYIRTKDGIFETEKYNHNPKMFQCLWGNILKQADTIEELCDEFIYDYGKDKDRFKNDKLALKILKANNNEKVNIYAAIWTSKGLIYVAKLNDKGELELI